MKKKASLIPEPTKPAVKKTSKPAISVHSNNDQVIIAWQYADPIEDCIGFAVYRKLNKETEDQALMNRVGFEGEAFTKGEQKPSFEWPIKDLSGQIFR